MHIDDNLPKILPPKCDIVFKMLFGNDRTPDILISFLEAVLKTKINSVLFLDTAIKPEYIDDKLSIVDVKAELENGERVDIEIQAKNNAEMRSRITYYSAGMLIEQMSKGDSYLRIKPVISIIITEKSIITESQKCHNVFSMLETEEHFPFSNLQEIHILDLSRIKNEKMGLLSDWLSFINSEKEEDFMAAAQKNETIQKAFGALKVISADEEQRMRYNDRLKAERDALMWVNEARREGIQQGMQEMLDLMKKGIPVSEIERMFSSTLSIK